MLTRKDFVRTCAVALCATGMSRGTAAPESVSGGAPGRNCDAGDLKSIKDRADAARLRFARLIETMEQSLPESDHRHILHCLGSKCADTYRVALINRYKGDLKGFLQEGLRNWMAEAEYDESAGTIRVVDKGPSCSCPLVAVGQTPASFCNCTLGWQEATYSFILGKPVKAQLEESILRGNKRCVYRIQVI